MEDAMIIDLFWARDESAIRETARKYGSYCAKIAANILKNSEDAEECVNDTYLRVWNAIPDERPSRFPPFICRIARNLSLNKYREQRAKKRGGDDFPLLLSELEDCVPWKGGTEAEFDLSQIAEAIDRFLDAADAESRVVFVRRYWYADSIADISERFGMSESKVKSMLFRTRNKLKFYLEREGVAI